MTKFSAQGQRRILACPGGMTAEICSTTMGLRGIPCRDCRALRGTVAAVEIFRYFARDVEKLLSPKK